MTNNMSIRIEQATAIRQSALLSFSGIFLILLLQMTTPAGAAVVNWIDPLNYQKPQPVDITMPDEASCPNKYYVDMTNGSGSTCSQTSPCGSIDNVLGKPGTNGGPAYIYIRGKGNWSGYNDTLQGSPGKEIVIKPWTGYTAIFTENSNANSSKINYIIIDGGPDLGIAFTSGGGGQYSFHWANNNYITVYRTRNYATAGGSMLLDVGGNGPCSNMKFINNEFYQCNQQNGYQCSAVYFGPGSSGGYTAVLFSNNIVRDMGGEGIEVNPRVTSTGLTISGNAIRNCGKQTCSGSWQCRPAITLNSQNGGSSPNNNTAIWNNLMWDLGASCIWGVDAGSGRTIYNNTCYQYNTGGAVQPQGFYGSNLGSVRNNVIYDPSGTAPFSTATGNNNMCGSGKSCGSSSVIYNVSVFSSTDQNSPFFLKLKEGSAAMNAGYDLSGIIAKSYSGGVRTAPFDIGADEYGSAPISPPPVEPTQIASPTGLKVVN